MPKQKPSAPAKRRNPLHDAPPLRKCAVHGKSDKARRQQDKSALRQEWRSPWDRIRRSSRTPFPFVPMAKLDKAADFYSADLGVRIPLGAPISKDRWPFVQRQDTGL